MKAVILAGGLGTRISEETISRPKPMIGIGGRPILWHIMKIYSSHGIHDFVICCGYMGYVIKEYFANYFLHMSDVTFDMTNNRMEIHQRHAEPWRVTLVDTGDTTQTGGRLGRVRQYVEDEEAFCFTYGDGGFINGGFFVLSPSVLALIDDDQCIWEAGPINQLIARDQLVAFQHTGFWRPMDTLRDKTTLEEMWNSGTAPWKTW